MNLKTDSHDTEEELKKVREILSNLEATEDSVQEKMVNIFLGFINFQIGINEFEKNILGPCERNAQKSQ